MNNLQTRMIAFAAAAIRDATDWQDVQTALLEHDEFSAALDGDPGLIQSVIRQAEASFQGNLPSDYA